LDVPPDPMGCYLYVMALCQRMAECRNLPVVSDGCLQSAAGCLDLATGRAPTNRGLRECAAAYADFSCELMLRGRRLECVSNGERSPGEPCSLALNCESLVCDYRAITEQYVCAELAGPGEECSAHVACTLGNTCTDGRCEPTPAPDFDNGNLPLGAAG